MMRNLFKAFVLSAVSFAPSVAWSESLADALIAAYRNSHLLEQNQAVLRAADEDVATAVGSLRPVVSFVSKFGRVDTTYARSDFSGFSYSGSSSLQASFTLLDFGRGKTTLALKNELVLASQAALVGVEQQVMFDAVQAYVNVALQADLVATQESNVNLIGQDLQATQDRFDVGERAL
jgi:outer membrane protein